MPVDDSSKLSISPVTAIDLKAAYDHLIEMITTGKFKWPENGTDKCTKTTLPDGTQMCDHSNDVMNYFSGIGLSPFISPAIAAGAPFILATPHHTMAWASGAAEPTAADYEAVIAQYNVALSSIEQAKQQCDSQIKALDAQKQRLVNDRDAMVKKLKGIKGTSKQSMP